MLGSGVSSHSPLSDPQLCEDFLEQFGFWFLTSDLLGFGHCGYLGSEPMDEGSFCVSSSDFPIKNKINP